jgi:hypothetical protein
MTSTLSPAATPAQPALPITPRLTSANRPILSPSSTTASASHSRSTSQQSPTLFPPHYASISHTSPSPTTPLEPDVQQTRNREKQALRDAWAEQSLSGPPRTLFPVAAIPRLQPVYQSGSSGDHGSSSRGRAGVSERLGSRGVLPEGMDVQEALARCEDATLGWSLQFWVTIADPLVGPHSSSYTDFHKARRRLRPGEAEERWTPRADDRRHNMSFSLVRQVVSRPFFSFSLVLFRIIVGPAC